MKLNKIDLTSYEKPSRFIKWQIGENRIRVLTEPYIFYVVGKKTGRGFVRQIIEDGVDVDPFFKDIIPKLQYGFVIFDHTSGKFKIFETGTMLGHALTELLQTDPENYKKRDVIVIASGEKLKRTYVVEWAKETKPMPDNVSKDSAEYRFVLSHFEGLK